MNNAMIAINRQAAHGRPNSRTTRRRERGRLSLAVATVLLLLALLPASSPVAADEHQNGVNSWSPTGAMSVHRFRQTATLLKTGQVLVAGGIDAHNTSQAAAELYNPATGTFAPTGLLRSARDSQTATLLPNGKVLLAGGKSNGTTLASAELYDPATGTFTPTGAMSTPRLGQTATLFSGGPDAGKVLVTGGGPSSAELYDPATGTWSLTGSMSTARADHSATLLANGQVLVAGGCSDPTCGTFNTSLAELYDPATGTFTSTGSLNISRAYQTAVLLPGGKVLATGGCGDFNCATNLTSAELYDPSTGTWTFTGAMNAPRVLHTATLLKDGTVLVAGGCANFDINNKCTINQSSAEVYNPASGIWSLTGAMSATRFAHTATLLPSGKVLVTGGLCAPPCSVLASAELYTPGAGPLVTLAPASLTFGLQLVGAPTMAQTVTITNSGTAPLIVSAVTPGGTNPADFPITATACTAAPLPPGGQCSVAVRFKPKASGSRAATLSITDNAPTSPQTMTVGGRGAAPNTWSPTGALNDARQYHTATLLPNGQVLVVGGVKIDNPVASAELYDPATATWTVTGSPLTGRYDHTATLLPSGQVLIAGGYGLCCSALSSAELYSPTTGTFTPTGNLTLPRAAGTATLLRNGLVLVAGGDNGVAVDTSSAELYNPSTGTFTPTGSMHVARDGQTATLLPSGKVLVSGGQSCVAGSCTTVASAELYDPTTGAWTLTGSMASARASQMATLLPTGKVLVSGGEAANAVALASAELYDPATGTFTPTGSLLTPRAQHTATLLPNGRVLVAGGCDGIYCASALAGAELYDPTTGTWTTTGSMVATRANHTATLLPNGQVLVAGGCSGTGICFTFAGAELYVPGPSPLIALSAASLAFGTQQVGGSVVQTETITNSGTTPLITSGVIVSGTNAADFSATFTCGAAPVPPGGQCNVTVRFAPLATGNRTASLILTANAPTSPVTIPLSGFGGFPNTWAPTGALNVAREGQTATLLPSGLVLVTGGCCDATGLILSSAELYNPATGAWTVTGNMTIARNASTATLLRNGTVLIAGGCNTPCNAVASTELYDPATGTFTPTGAMTTPRYGATATLLPSGKVLVAGGYGPTGAGQAGAELYDPATGTFTPTGAMTVDRANHTATLLPDGQVLIAGGNSGGNPVASAELYDPGAGTFTATAPMSASRAFHTATLLPNGQVLVAGGLPVCCGSLSSAELYDPGASTWTTTGSMAVGRRYHTATLLSTGQVLVAGGMGGGASAELYDPGTGTWSLAKGMTTSRAYHTATLLPNGDVLVAGGCLATDCLAYTSAELYEPALLGAKPAGGTVGQRVTVSGANFLGFEPVALYWDSTGTTPLATATSGNSGVFVGAITVPPASPGTHTLIAVGRHSGATASVAFQVT